MKLKVTQNYSRSKVTIGDLRQIVDNAKDLPASTDVRINKHEGDRPGDSPWYTIDVGDIL